jgi:hypothetical protein
MKASLRINRQSEDVSMREVAPGLYVAAEPETATISFFEDSLPPQSDRFTASEIQIAPLSNWGRDIRARD